MNHHDVVDVITGARLHFGLLCGTPESGWIFGGVGMMVRQPGWHLQLRRTSVPLEIRTTDPVTREKIQRTLQQWDDGKNPLEHGVCIQVISESPWHCGFGAGTQLALGLVGGLDMLLQSQRSGNIMQRARQIGRASRSVVGTAGFARGGFIVDPGQPIDGSRDRAPQHFTLPDEWRFVLVRPCHVRGLSGEPERQYFERQQTMADATVACLAGIIEKRLVPAIRSRDFSGFAEALGDYGHEAGRFYAPEQGDVFADPRMSLLVHRLKHLGVRGCAQSSWGPGICIPAESDADAGQVVRQISGFVDAEQLDVMVTEPRNYGATIRMAAPETGGHHWL